MKNFIITCPKCRWKYVTTGITSELEEEGLKEISNNCVNCGSPRKFHCMRCGGVAKMIRVRGNS